MRWSHDCSHLLSHVFAHVRKYNHWQHYSRLLQIYQFYFSFLHVLPENSKLDLDPLPPKPWSFGTILLPYLFKDPWYLTQHCPNCLRWRGKRKLTLNRPGGIRSQACSFLCCAETVSSRKLKLSDFYCILIGLNSEYKPVPWDIHCCHGSAIVEGCSVKFWLKSVKIAFFCSNRFLISV